MYNLIIATIKDLIKSPVFLSTITALCTWWVKNKNVKFKNRRVELYRLIRINYYYQNEINGDHVTLNEIMRTINNISENFDMTDEVIGLTNSFIDAHNPNPNIPTYEKYQRLIRLELELAKQCQWFNFLCKYKTQHSIEKVHTYVPNGAIEYNQRNFMLMKYMVEYYDKLVNHNARQL